MEGRSEVIGDLWGCGRAGVNPEVDPGVGQGGCEDLGAGQQKPQFLGSVPSSAATFSGDLGEVPLSLHLHFPTWEGGEHFLCTHGLRQVVNIF